MLNANAGEHRCTVVSLNMLTLASIVRVNLIVNSSELAGFEIKFKQLAVKFNLLCLNLKLM